MKFTDTAKKYTALTLTLLIFLLLVGTLLFYMPRDRIFEFLVIYVICILFVLIFKRDFPSLEVITLLFMPILYVLIYDLLEETHNSFGIRKDLYARGKLTSVEIYHSCFNSNSFNKETVLKHWHNIANLINVESGRIRPHDKLNWLKIDIKKLTSNEDIIKESDNIITVEDFIKRIYALDKTKPSPENSDEG